MTPSTRNRILNYLSVLTEWTSAQQVAKGIGTTTRETGQHLHLLWLEGSCWPLWCGSLGVTVDTCIAAQLAYHLCRLDCDDPEYITARNAIVDFANKFHRVDECGVLRHIPIIVVE